MYSILTPSNSFVRFDGETVIQHCIFGEFSNCLPVYAEDDIAFQFIVTADTPEEIALLCEPAQSGISIGIVLDCEQEGFTALFDEDPERFKISDLQVLFNWPHGVPGMIGNVISGECFYIRVVVGEQPFCTNCFQRIPEDCFTSVVEYGNNENFAGFNYCNSGGIDEDGLTCEPYVVTFTNQSMISIPYTASLQAKFGEVPTVQVWIYDESGNLVNMGVTATFDAMPPTMITVDPGGPSSGIIVIR